MTRQGKELVFFLEEPSTKAMLETIMPQVLPDFIDDCIDVRYVVFEGKQDLKKKLRRRLKAWHNKQALFVVMCDQDAGECETLKQILRKKCVNAGKPECLVRIACRELESFYLGDLAAVSRAFDNEKLESRQSKKKFRNPDLLASPSQELKKLVPDYQKVSGSRAIASEMTIESNRSPSFNVLITGIKKLLEFTDEPETMARDCTTT